MVFGLWESIVADADMEVKDVFDGLFEWFRSPKCSESPELSRIPDLDLTERSETKPRALRNNAPAVMEVNRGHIDGKFTATTLTPISS